LLGVLDGGLGKLGAAHHAGQFFGAFTGIEAPYRRLRAPAHFPFLDNEVLVGNAIRGRRDKVFLATKFAIVRDRANPGVRGVSGKPEYVRSANTPIEETVGAMAGLVGLQTEFRFGLAILKMKFCRRHANWESRSLPTARSGAAF